MTQENSNHSDANFDELSFEQALTRLDETVQALEQGGLALADSTRLFEEGMKLARICNEMLVGAELHVTRIQTAYGEQMRMLEEAESYQTEESS